MKINIGIIGGAGYTGGELLRILLNHPQVNINFVNSKSQAGKPVYSTHGDLLGETDLLFSDEQTFENVDALFLCSGHNESRKFLAQNNVLVNIKIIEATEFDLYGEPA